MDKITFSDEVTGVEVNGVKVYLGKKLVGTIHRVEGGWSYKPKGSRTSGDVFQQLVDCKRSLTSF